MTKRREFTPKTKAAVRKRSGGICEADGCDRPAAEIDHKVECWEGGDNSLENAKDLCVECHLEKTNHSKSLKAWGNHFKVVKGRPKSGKIKSRGFQRGKSKIPSRPFEQKKQKLPTKKEREAYRMRIER